MSSSDPIEPNNINLSKKLSTIKDTCSRLMSQTRAIGGFKYYIGHDEEHLNYVWRNASNIIHNKNTGKDIQFLNNPWNHRKEKTCLNDVEKFILGASCYAHDLGMLAILNKCQHLLLTEDYEESEIIRKKHAEHTEEIIHRTGKLEHIFSDNDINFTLNWICLICGAHSNYDMDNKFRKISMDYLKYNRVFPDIEHKDECLLVYSKVRYKNIDYIIRPALLSAILRLADALCYSDKDTLRHMDVICNCTSALSQKMQNNKKQICVEFKANSKEYQEEFFQTYQNLGSHRATKLIPFLYKQIIEYWKHEITEDIAIRHNNKNDIEILLIFYWKTIKYPYLIGTEPSCQNDKTPLQMVVWKKINEELNSVKTVFEAYDVNIQLSPTEKKIREKIEEMGKNDRLSS